MGFRLPPTEGETFCAGRDLKETDPERDDTNAILAELINPVLLRLHALPIPSLALVRGPKKCATRLSSRRRLWYKPARNRERLGASGMCRPRPGPPPEQEQSWTTSTRP